MMRNSFIWLMLVILGLVLMLLPPVSGEDAGIESVGRSPRSLFFIKSRLRRRRLNLRRKNNVFSTDVPEQVKRHRRGIFKI